MIVDKRLSPRIIYSFSKLDFLVLLFFGAVTYAASIFMPQQPTSLFPSITVFGTVLSLFLAFKTNEGYNRWWEARTLWGGIVNSSRIWARQVMVLVNPEATGLDGEELKKTQKELIYRHLAYINAVRINLRRGESWADLEPFLDPEEYAGLGDRVNKPTALVHTQGKELRKIFKGRTDEQFRYLQMDRTLDEFYNLQGACERIKGTVFPQIYASYTKYFTWLFAFGLIFSLFDEFDWHVFMVRILVAYVFVSLEKLSRYLRDPFENRMSDTPMTALCRTIEIDLRQMLGEKEIPQPVKPVDGVLM